MSEKETTVEIKKSVASIYNQLADIRKQEQEERKEKRRIQKEREAVEKEDKYRHPEEDRMMTKKEKREAEAESWREVIVGLTGDDLNYGSTKKRKKKYKKWIFEDENTASITVAKPKKKKKKDYNKEFEPELNMLKAIVRDQNKFTEDLQKRYQVAAGPNTKDANPLNKTLVELAAVINTSRNNSLGVLREIGHLKDIVAKLYFKQRELDAKQIGEISDDKDLGLVGSDIMATLLRGNERYINDVDISTDTNPTSSVSVNTVVQEEWNPDSWSGVAITDDDPVRSESIPHKVVVLYDEGNNSYSFAALRNDTGEAIQNYKLPPVNSIVSIDKENLRAKGQFDQIYDLKIVG